MEATEPLKIKLCKGATSDVRYYVLIDGEKIGWVSKRTPYEWDKDRSVSWIAYHCPEGEFQGRRINTGERHRRDAISTLLIYCNAGTHEQRFAWWEREMKKAYGV